LLGSASLTLAGDGTFQAVQLFDPYGSVRFADGTMPTSFNFTGQRFDDLTGLLYFNFRYYDPVSGRFVRADTVETNIQGRDPYLYVGGNPESATDPTGHNPLAALALIVGGAVLGAIGGVASVYIQGAINGKLPSAETVAKAAISGAIVGGVIAPVATFIVPGLLGLGYAMATGTVVEGLFVMELGPAPLATYFFSIEGVGALTGVANGFADVAVDGKPAPKSTPVPTATPTPTAKRTAKPTVKRTVKSTTPSASPSRPYIPPATWWEPVYSDDPVDSYLGGYDWYRSVQESWERAGNTGNVSQQYFKKKTWYAQKLTEARWWE